MMDQYEKSTTCFSDLSLEVNKLFDDGKFKEGHEFSNFFDFLFSCKVINRKFYFSALRLQLIKNEEKNLFKNCLLTNFDNFKNISVIDLKNESLGLIKIHKNYIRPIQDCGKDIFSKLDLNIENKI